MASNLYVFKSGIAVTSTVPSTSVSTGALTVAGGLGVGGTLTCTSLSASSTSQGSLSLTSTSDASSSITGALTVGGGAGIAKSLYVGTGTTVGGNLTVGSSAGAGGTLPIVQVQPFVNGQECSIGFSKLQGAPTASLIHVLGMNMVTQDDNFSLYNSTLAGKVWSATPQGDFLVKSDTSSLVSLQPSRDDIWRQGQFTGQQGQATAVPVTGLAVSSGTLGFEAIVHCRLSATSSGHAVYKLMASSDGTSWNLVSHYVGSDVGVSFGITSGGAITYTSQTYSGFTSLLMRFRLVSIHV